MYETKQFFTLKDGRSELYQWDTGVELQVSDELTQIHMSVSSYGTSLDVDVADGIAKIPDILLQKGDDLNVWGFIETEESGFTKAYKKIKVNRRNKPADYIYTPENQTNMQKIITMMGDLDKLNTEAKEDLVSAVNEALTKGGGVVDYNKIAEMIETYLEEKPPVPGNPGTDGKSAYQYAQDGGYTGTEEEFAEKMAKEITQPDWNASEGETGHILNRTHWTEGNGKVEILPECQPLYVKDNGYFVVSDNVQNFTVGETYTVSWNGVEYICIAQEYSQEDEMTAVVLGDLGLMTGGISTGEPFVIIRYPDDYFVNFGLCLGIIPLDGSTELTVAIYHGGEIVHKLDNKYLDLDWLPTIGEIQIAAEKTVTPTIGQPTETGGGFPDLTESMVYEGMPIIVYLDGVRHEGRVTKDASEGGYVFVNYSPFFMLTFLSDYTHFSSNDDIPHVACVYTYEYNKMPEKFLPEVVNNVILRSSTAGSTKKFKLTVNDSGTISATEV